MAPVHPGDATTVTTGQLKRRCGDHCSEGGEEEEEREEEGEKKKKKKDDEGYQD